VNRDTADAPLRLVRRASSVGLRAESNHWTLQEFDLKIGNVCDSDEIVIKSNHRGFTVQSDASDQ
jgi:hypothetical protein